MVRDAAGNAARNSGAATARMCSCGGVKGKIMQEEANASKWVWDANAVG